MVYAVGLLNSQEPIRIKKVLGKPKRFEMPKGYDDMGQITDFISERGKTTKNSWIVVSDRDNNIVYDEPDGEPLEFKLKFKDYFFVMDEERDWIHIVKVEKPKPIKLKVKKGAKVLDYGWVEKSKMLLWTKGLVDPNSNIHQKAFLLNKAVDLKRLTNGSNSIKKNLATIYTDPVKSNVAEQRHIYEFYFILKKEDHRVLLANAASLSTYSLDETIIGWVNSNRLEEWNTRVALEPNFHEEAYNERKADLNKRLIGYADEEGANFHTAMGLPHEGHVHWDNDPVKLSENQLGNDSWTKHRFKGSVIRFPLFRKIGKLYRSGVIGNINVKTFGKQMETISEIDYSSIQKKIESMKISSINYDILFVVEGREDMEDTKLALKNAINNIKLNSKSDINYRFAIAIYRDIYDRKDNRMFKILPLTSSKTKINDFIDNLVFGSSNDFDDWTTIHYNLKQAILQAGFNKEHTNILFLIGTGGDYRATVSRRIRAKKEKDETFIRSREITELMASFNINISFIQAINKGTEPYRWFLDQAKYLVLETAKAQFNIYRNINDFVPDMNLHNPEIGDNIYNSKVVKLTGGSNFGEIVWPFENNRYSGEELAGIIEKGVSEIEKSKSSFSKILTDVFIKGNSFENSAGSLAAPMAKFLKEIMGDKLDKDVIKKLLREKYKLYTEVYLPAHIKGAEYPTTSYVLFMPNDELSDYINQLDKLAVAADMDISKQRIELYNTLVDLLNQYTGFDMSKKEIKNATLDDLRNKMQGLSKEGVSLTGFQNFRLADIRDDRRMSDEKVYEFVDNVLSKLKRLKKILSLKGKYEFSYTSELNTYFWIPVEYTL